MKYRLQDLIDIEQFQSLQDRLTEICPFPSAIIDNDGVVLTSTAWQDICTKFHRQHPECEKACIKSDQYILDHLDDADPAVSYRCPHGLVDNAMPIIVEGHHLGNFFTGQLFMEEPDLDFFRAQAAKFGCDEEAYLDAVRKVPVWDTAQRDSYLRFIKELIALISSVALKSLKELEAARELQEANARHSAMIAHIGDVIGIMGADGIMKYKSPNIEKWFGWNPEDLVGTDGWKTVHPDDVERIKKDFEALTKDANASITVEYRYKCKDGTYTWIELTAVNCIGDPAINGILLNYHDITERKHLEERLRQTEKMEAISAAILTMPSVSPTF
jgi:PAS domain S-box-containing protein